MLPPLKTARCLVSRLLSLRQTVFAHATVACLLLVTPIGAVAEGFFTLEHDALIELSGMAPSAQSDFLWGHNDYGNQPRLFRIAPDGTDLGTVRVKGVRNVDWEDMTWRDGDDGRILFIGDIGDNRGQRDDIAIIAVTEPTADAQTVDVLWRRSLHYPEGPRDAEGLAFDARENLLYLLSKRDTPPRLYRLQANDGPSQTAEMVSDLTLPAPPFSLLFSDPRRALMFNLPTALDITRDGRRMAVLTYGAVYVFDRADAESWAQALERQPGRVIFPPMRQAEALAISNNGRAALIGSEGDTRHMQTVDLPDFNTERQRFHGPAPATMRP